MLVKKTDIKGFCKDKEPILSILKGETKAEPILRSGKCNILMRIDQEDVSILFQMTVRVKEKLT